MTAETAASAGHQREPRSWASLAKLLLPSMSHRVCWSNQAQEPSLHCSSKILPVCSSTATSCHQFQFALQLDLRLCQGSTGEEPCSCWEQVRPGTSCPQARPQISAIAEFKALPLLARSHVPTWFSPPFSITSTAQFAYRTQGLQRFRRRGISACTKGLTRSD